MIKVNNICYSYENSKTKVLNNIRLNINKGELIVITGPSGSGKTTLAKILTGHMIPTSGDITFEGLNYTGKPGRHSILIHQESDLFPWFTVREQIELAIKLNTDMPNQIEFYLELARLNDVSGFYPFQLSGGMKKRASLVRALAANPKLLILDETFSSLDSELHLELAQDLKQIWLQTQTTILLMTHDPRDINLFGQKRYELTALSNHEN